MTTLEILFGIAIPVTMAIIALILLGVEVYISWQFGRPVKKRESSDDLVYKHVKPEDDYLVVCRTKKQAMYWRKELLKHIADCYTKDEIKVINNYGKYICLYFPRTHLTVRFVSEKDYFEASRGFRGWIVEQYQLEDWIWAAESNSVV